MYSVQSAYLSGTAETLTIVIAVYASPATIIAVKIMPLDLFILNLKLNVSKEITSNPTNAHGARKIILYIPYAILVFFVPNILRALPEIT